MVESGPRAPRAGQHEGRYAAAFASILGEHLSSSFVSIQSADPLPILVSLCHSWEIDSRPSHLVNAAGLLDNVALTVAIALSRARPNDALNPLGPPGMVVACLRMEHVVSMEKVLYIAHAMAIGGRDGHAVSSNGTLDVKLARPPELGGTGPPGANPEQLFAVAYSASLIDSIKLVAARDRAPLRGEVTIEASIALGTTTNGLGLQATLKISLPGLPRDEARLIVQRADRLCPYSNAVHGNMAVRLIVL